MGNGEKDNGVYVAFKVKDNMYAMPINDTQYIMQISPDIPRAVLPNAPACVDCIMELQGELVTVINLQKDNEGMQVMEKYIVVLDHAGFNIGIIVTEVHLEKVFEKEISEDKVAGTRAFIHEGTMYSILDICQIYKTMGIKIKDI